MTTEKIMSEHDFQRKLIDIMNFRLIGIQIIAPPINPIIPSEFGGTLYQFNLYTVNKKKNYSKKLEIHAKKNKELYLQLLDVKSKNLDWWRDFSDIEKLAENFSKELKEVLPN